MAQAHPAQCTPSPPMPIPSGASGAPQKRVSDSCDNHERGISARLTSRTYAPLAVATAVATADTTTLHATHRPLHRSTLDRVAQP